MSTAATIPVFDPQGILRDVPQDQLQIAVKAGGVPSVRFKAPNGDVRFVPANRTQEAVKAGGQLLPFEQQELQHPGFWSTLSADLKGMVSSAYHGIVDYDPLTDPKLPDSQKNAIVTAQQNAAAAQNKARTQAHGLPYSLGSTAAEMFGSNVSGMEESAEQGDVAGVYGHAAAAPAAMLAAEAISQGGPIAAEKSAPLVRTAVKTANKVLPRVVGGAAGGALGAATHVPFAAPTLAAIGARIGPDILPKGLRIPGEGFGLPNRVTGGPAVAPSYAESLGPVTGGPAVAPSYAESLGPVQGGPANAPSFEEFSGKLADMNKPAVADTSTIESRLRSIQSKIKRQKAPAPAEEDLVAKGVESRQAVIDQKVLAELNKTGKDLQVSLESLGKSPALQRFSPEEIEQSSVRLRDAGKISRMETGGGAHASRYVVMLK